MLIAETDRLLIEEAQLKDAPFYYELLNSDNWIRYIGDREIKTVNDAKDYIKNTIFKSYKELGYGLFTVRLKSDLAPIGICGFLLRDYLDEPDIGFAILPQFQGLGLISEASLACMKKARDWKFNKIYGITTEQNEASKAVLKKLGMDLVDRHMEHEEVLLIYSVILY